MTVTELADELQDQVLDAVKQAQGFAVDAVRSWTGAVDGFVPDLSTLPFADQLPSAAVAVEKSFDFVQTLLANQREFVRDLLVAAAPLVSNHDAPASK